jgi:glutaminase
LQGNGTLLIHSILILIHPQKLMHTFLISTSVGDRLANQAKLLVTSFSFSIFLAKATEKWQFIQEGLSRFAGRTLTLNEAVYQSEAATNQRNQGIAKLLLAYDRIFFDPIVATDIYTQQCSLNVTAKDLAVMAATLANGGVNPLTADKIIDPIHCQHVLAVMVTAGLYENSGDWLYETGLPGKSGVSGGMITVSPGKGGLGTFAPPLDAAGNSVKGQKVTRFLAQELGLNLFASQPYGQS